MEKLTFMTDDNDSVELYIIEETRANGVNYLLVTDSDDEEDGDAQCYILKDTSAAEDAEAAYEFVEDDTAEYLQSLWMTELNLRKEQVCAGFWIE